MRIFTGLIMAALLLAESALAHDFRLGTLAIDHPWVRATPPGATTAAAYLTIANTGTEADRLLGAVSPLGKVDLHMMEIVDGVMKMRPVADGLEIPAGATVKLAPGGHHLMLTGLAAAVAIGSQPALTLTFARAGTIEVGLAVEPIGAPEPHRMH